MKLYALILLIITRVIATEAQIVNGIDFRKDKFKVLLTMAESENKLLFLDLYADWCGPCKVMDKKVFSQDSVSTLYNQSFICAKFNIEIGEGKEIQQKYNIETLPTFLFLDKNGNVVYKHVGAMEAAPFIQLGLDALNPQKNILSIKYELVENSSDAEKVLNTIQTLKKTGSTTDTIALNYLNKLPESELFNIPNIRILLSTAELQDTSFYFKFILKHQDSIIQYYNPEEVYTFLFNSYYQHSLKLLSQSPIQEELLKSYINQTEKYASNNKNRKKAQQTICTYFALNFQKDSAIQNIIKYAETYTLSAQELHMYAYAFSHNYKSNENLIYAKKWAAQSVGIKPGMGNSLGYASILYELKEFELAKKYVIQAKEFSKKEDRKNKDINKLLRKINKAIK